MNQNENAQLRAERNRLKLSLQEIMSVDQKKPSAASRMGEIADRALSLSHSAEPIAAAPPVASLPTPECPSCGTGCGGVAQYFYCHCCEQFILNGEFARSPQKARYAAPALRSALQRLDLKFRSGNSIPVERATILASEWEPVRAALSESVASPADSPVNPLDAAAAELAKYADRCVAILWKSMDPREGKYYANKTAEAIKTVLRILRESQGEHHHTAEGAGHE